MQLLDQLKVLQMVLRKERDKDSANSLLVTDNSSFKTQFQLAPASEKDFKQKVEEHKKITEQRRQDKLKQMDSEAQALFHAINKEETQSSKDINVSQKYMH